MIKLLFEALFEFVIGLINLLLTPLNSLFSSLLPNISIAVSSIGAFLAICISSIGWVISALGIPTLALQVIVLYYGFILVAPLIVHTLKSIIKWYRTIVP